MIQFIIMSNFSSARTSRFNSSKYLQGRSSNSPNCKSSHSRLATTRSQRSLWSRSYKNQPIPMIIGRRLIGRKYNFLDGSDFQQEEIIAVQEEQQQENIEGKKRRLPIFKVVSDWDQFSEYSKGRIHSQRKRNRSAKRCRSVESLKLPRVEEQKREQDDLRKKPMTKLTAIRDNNQFGQQRTRRSSSSYTQVVSRVQSVEAPQYTALFNQQIEENQAQQTKSVKLPNQKSIITSELEKLIVDQLDDKKKKKQEVLNDDFQSIIEQEKHEEDVDTGKLRHLLQKFEEESGYINDDQKDYDSEKASGKNLRFSNNQDQDVKIVHEEQSEENQDKSEEEKL